MTKQDEQGHRVASTETKSASEVGGDSERVYPGVHPEPLVCERCKAPDPIVAACPYRSEISGNENPCACCRGCRHECAMDI